MAEYRRESKVPRLWPSPEEAREAVADHQAAVHRLHPDLKSAYDAWQRGGYQGSIYDFLPGNYRHLLK